MKRTGIVLLVGALLTTNAFAVSKGSVPAKAPPQQTSCGLNNRDGVASVCGAMPVGTVLTYAGSVAPAGFLLCDGSAIDRNTFSQLFSVLQVTYGPGDGATTFNIPDLRGRVAVGKDDMGGTSSLRLSDNSGIAGTTLGSAGGESMHALSTDEMPSHSHGASESAHNHSFYVQAAGGGPINGGNGIGGAPGIQSGAGTVFDRIDVTSTAASISVGAAGGGLSHNNLQPSMIMNYIIKY